MRCDATDDQVRAVTARIEELGMTAYRDTSQGGTVLAALGEPGPEAAGALAMMAGVHRVSPLTRPFPLASRDFRPADTVVWVKGVPIGGPFNCVLAGPCSIEGPEMLFRIARHCQELGASVLRAGAFKPRTSPYSFQGLGAAGLKLLRECGDELGLPVCTEVLDPRQVELVERHADLIQIGARNMQNFNLLREVGRTRKPVLLKRGLAASVQEFLMSAEYLLAEGNGQVVLCERGIKTFETSVRYTLDVACVPVARELSHLPIIVDPSHAAGRRELVTPLAWAGIGAGAHGLIVEVHDQPEKALSDGPQALRGPEFARLMGGVRALSHVLGRRLGADPEWGFPADNQPACGCVA
jgi:3-deoxy-7-phosphoheptulonate synthase